MALINKPCWTGGINRVGIAGNAIMLSVRIALAVMGATDDDGMSDVTTDEVDENMLSMTQRISLSHVVGDEVTGDGYPVRAVVTIVAALFSTVFTLPMVSDMGTMVTIMSNGATIGVNDTGAHKTCQTRMRLSNCSKLFSIGNMMMMRKR